MKSNILDIIRIYSLKYNQGSEVTLVVKSPTGIPRTISGCILGTAAGIVHVRVGPPHERNACIVHLDDIISTRIYRIGKRRV